LEVLRAVYYLVCEGCRWRALNGTIFGFPPWQSVYSRWRLWIRTGWLDRTWQALVKPCGRLRFLDASHIKVHQDACRHKSSYEARCIGRTKGGLNARVTAVVDARGRVVAFCLAPGNRHDLKAMRDIKHCLRLVAVVADRGYDAAAMRREIEAMQSRAQIPSRKSNNVQHSVSKSIYRKRHLVENAFQRMNRMRRTGTRYDQLTETFSIALTLSFIIDWVLR
jgi:transposase